MYSFGGCGLCAKGRRDGVIRCVGAVVPADAVFVFYIPYFDVLRFDVAYFGLVYFDVPLPSLPNFPCTFLSLFPSLTATLFDCKHPRPSRPVPSRTLEEFPTKKADWAREMPAKSAGCSKRKERSGWMRSWIWYGVQLEVMDCYRILRRIF